MRYESNGERDKEQVKARKNITSESVTVKIDNRAMFPFSFSRLSFEQPQAIKNNISTSGIVHWFTQIWNIARRPALKWGCEMKMDHEMDRFFSSSIALFQRRYVRCKRKIRSGIMWFLKWNYELVKSFFSLRLFVFIIDESAT